MVTSDDQWIKTNQLIQSDSIRFVIAEKKFDKMQKKTSSSSSFCLQFFPLSLPPSNTGFRNQKDAKTKKNNEKKTKTNIKLTKKKRKNKIYCQ